MSTLKLKALHLITDNPEKLINLENSPHLICQWSKKQGHGGALIHKLDSVGTICYAQKAKVYVGLFSSIEINLIFKL